MNNWEAVTGGYNQLLSPARVQLMQEAARLINDEYGVAMFEVHVHPEQVNWEGKPIHNEAVRIVVGGLWKQRSWSRLTPLWDKMRELEAEGQAEEQ